MKIIVINGSPRGVRSNTMKLTESFIDGLTNQIKNSVVDTITLSNLNISHCLGCFNCWTNTPGKCAIKDDMAEILEKYITADIVVWSFPLYTYGMPSKIKAFLDRLLPISLPLLTNNNGKVSHPSRYDLSHQRHVLISTCGFCSINGNYDALFKQFDILFGQKLTKITCAEGELFSVPQLAQKCNQYLSYVKKAGEDYAKTKSLTLETHTNLSQLLYPGENFIEMANASWNIQSGKHNVGNKERAVNFLNQMTAVYNKTAYSKSTPTTLEFCFTDLDEIWQLKFDRNGCKLLSGNEPYTTRIESNFDTWMNISSGKISGDQALFDKKYSIKGDFSLLLSLSKYFGSSANENINTNENIKKAGTPKKKKSNMLFCYCPG